MNAQMQSAPTFTGALDADDQLARLTYFSKAFLMTSETVSLRWAATSNAASQTSSGIRTERKGLDAIVNLVHFVNKQLKRRSVLIAIKSVFDIVSPQLELSKVKYARDVATPIAFIFNAANDLTIFHEVSNPSNSVGGLKLSSGVHFVFHESFLSLRCIYTVPQTVYTAQAHFKNTFGRVA
jgi:hypothetical protein